MALAADVIKSDNERTQILSTKMQRKKKQMNGLEAARCDAAHDEQWNYVVLSEPLFVQRDNGAI